MREELELAHLPFQQRVFKYDPQEIELEQQERNPFLPEPSTPLIFDDTSKASLAQRATSLGIGALFWAAWLALWTPVATAFIWVGGSVWGLSELVQAKEDSLPSILLLLACGFALASFLILIGTLEWAKNLRCASRSSTACPLDAQTLADSHGLQVEQLQKAWAHRRLVVHHTTEGQVQDVEASLPRP